MPLSRNIYIFLRYFGALIPDPLSAKSCVIKCENASRIFQGTLLYFCINTPLWLNRFFNRALHHEILHFLLFTFFLPLFCPLDFFTLQASGKRTFGWMICVVCSTLFRTWFRRLGSLPFVVYSSLFVLLIGECPLGLLREIFNASPRNRTNERVSTASFRLNKARKVPAKYGENKNREQCKSLLNASKGAERSLFYVYETSHHRSFLLSSKVVLTALQNPKVWKMCSRIYWNFQNRCPSVHLIIPIDFQIRNKNSDKCSDNR